MFRFKALATIGAIALLALSACSDITSPTTPSGFCPVVTGSGTCEGGGVIAHR